MYIDKLLKIIRAIFKPARLFYWKLKTPISAQSQDILKGILFFCVMCFVYIKCYPYSGIINLALVTAGALLLALGCIFVATKICSKLVEAVTMLLYIPALIYVICDDKINNVPWKEDNTATTAMTKDPRTEVGITYFIEREKRIQVNHAQYFGPN